MRFFSFTPQEIKALLFLLMALVVGSGITIYKRHHRSFAPELILNQSLSGSFENQSQFNETSKDTSHEISKSSKAFPISNQIGPALSQRIIDYRKTKGKFQKIEDLMKVSGIGPKTFEKIKDLIIVK